MKPCMHQVEISIFLLNHVVIRLTKMMNISKLVLSKSFFCVNNWSNLSAKKILNIPSFIICSLSQSQVYLLFSLLPLIFHDHAWSTIAYLRYLNVTDNEGWLEIDQEKLRSRTSSITWATTALKLALIIPLGHFLLNNDSKTNIEHPNYVPIAVVFLLILTLVPYLTAFFFYFRIFLFLSFLLFSSQIFGEIYPKKF